VKRIKIHPQYCIGCKLCEIHCIVAHSSSGDIIKAFKAEQPRALARVIVEDVPCSSFAVQCRHCDDAPCIDGCIGGAMRRDAQTGAVVHDPDKCIGCWMCIMLCPYGVIERDLAKGGVASKCDLCAQHETPVCVANCPNEALTIEEE